ncbi:hypothetical protein BGZ83_004486 [Gryganskiella cystojenkinii]|nr:hypothetical protein BGZ83_004486 [Gryganskiella cystojenkinii]
MDQQQQQQNDPSLPQSQQTQGQQQQQQQEHPGEISTTTGTGTPPEGATLAASAPPAPVSTTTAATLTNASTLNPTATAGSVPSTAMETTSTSTEAPTTQSAYRSTSPAPPPGTYPPPDGPPPSSNLINVPSSYPLPASPAVSRPPSVPPAPTVIPAAAQSSTSTTSSAAPAITATVSSGTTQGKQYWCHKCQREITPILTPDPVCPNCYNDFVEEIEATNDPRTFAVQPPDATRGNNNNSQYPGTQSTGERNVRRADEPVNLEDLFQLWQAVANPQRAAQQQHSELIQQWEQRNQQREQRQQPASPFAGPGHTTSSSHSFVFSSGPSGFTRTVTTIGPDGRPQTTRTSTGGSAGSNMSGTGSDGDSGEPQWHTAPSFINGLLNRLGIQFSYTTDPRALQGFMGGGGGAGLFPMVGNPGDYAWGQGGLDDIISQMMELQNRQHGPVAATDEIINNIPHHTLSDAELADKTECSVCKEEFTKEDTLLNLPCKHIFHDACIKPWLKVSGTCPTCRYSLVEGRHASTEDDHHHAPSGNVTNAGTGTGAGAASGGAPTTQTPGSFPSAPVNNPSYLPPHEPLD